MSGALVATKDFYPCQKKGLQQTLLTYSPQSSGNVCPYPQASGTEGPQAATKITLEEHTGAGLIILQLCGLFFQTGISLHNLYGKSLLVNLLRKTLCDTNVVC